MAWFKIVKGITLAFLLVCVVGCEGQARVGGADVVPEMSLSLAGEWGFQLDPKSVGEEDKWFERDLPLRIKLPGSTVEGGFGDDITVETEWTGDIVDRSWYTEERYEKYRQPGNVKVPFWLTPLKHYVGAAWYERTVDIPASWRDKRVILFLERAHWETKVWVDGKEIGMRNSLSTPHEYDIGSLSPGEHRLTIRVDNTIKIAVGVNSHSISDHTQTNWNGIVGKMELRAKEPIWIDDLQVYPDVKGKTAKVLVTLRKTTKEKVEGIVILQAQSAEQQHKPAAKRMLFTASLPYTTIEAQYDMGNDVLLWDEFAPNVYQMTASIEAGKYADSKRVDFGMREFATSGTQFTINGRKRFLRGTLECSIFPLTGYPHMDVEGWLRMIGRAKAHGLNHFRFHSWCPPEAAFVAADRLGFMFQVECGSWANQGSTLGDGRSIDGFLYTESDRILKAYGNHPSFCMLAYGNEPAGKNHMEFLGDLVDYWKGKDPRRVYTSAAGWAIVPENQYQNDFHPRIHYWEANLTCRLNSKPPETVTDYRDIINKYDVPVVSHEIGEWCVYPNFEEIKKYTGVTRAYNFEIFRDSLEENHMLDQAHDFLMASGKLQTICYKEEIESALRTPGFGGFQLLDLHDFPGQGTALVGVLDAFWDSKGYVTPEEYSRFSRETVPLARMEKRIWTSNETFRADIEIAHFGPAPLGRAVTLWEITDSEGNRIAFGQLPARNIPLGNCVELGKISLPLGNVTEATKMVLTVAIKGTAFSNDWDFWVYPKDIDTTVTGDIVITDELNTEALDALRAGGKVMLMPGPDMIKGDRYGKIPAGFTTIFWNTAWTSRQAPHTLGILCDPAHPALKDFPTEYHSNWQWWDLVTKSQIMILNDLPVELRPIVQVIDDWSTNRRLGLIFEAEVAGGKLLVCSIDLRSNLDGRPVAQQMLHSLKSYMQSDAFAPTHDLEVELIEDLIKEPSVMTMLGARVIKVDSQNSGNEGNSILDGSPRTIWHTSWQGDIPGYPHEFVLDLKNNVSMKGFTALPRQDGNANGMIGGYEIYVSNDSDDWGGPVSEGVFEPGEDLKTVYFDKLYSGRYLRFKAISPVNPEHPWASLAEFEIIEE
ncbi:MAG: discoidin domain-containing protein [Planctomycetota bacterium]|nr:MAG: discoidin domain-containing protein [Planctomycetota bacterium]